MAKQKKRPAPERVPDVENTGHPDPVPGPGVGPVLELIHCGSAGSLDDCQEEILRQQSDRYPIMAVPSPASIDRWIDAARRAVAS